MAGESPSLGTVFVDVVPRFEPTLENTVRRVVREELLKLFSLPVLSKKAVEQLYAEGSEGRSET